MREKYGLGAAALCDPDDALVEYGKNALVLLLDASGTIAYKKVVSSHTALKTKLDAMLP